MKTVLKRSDLLHDISNLAYVIADVSEGKETPHALHQTFDICEPGNVDRIDSLLTLAATEVGATLTPVGSLAIRRDRYILIFNGLSVAIVSKVTECVREYMVASALYGWLSVTLPNAADFWASRKEAVLTALCRVASSHLAAFRRHTPPI